MAISDERFVEVTTIVIGAGAGGSGGGSGGGPVISATWGSIDGDIQDQTDLIELLEDMGDDYATAAQGAKADTAVQPADLPMAVLSQLLTGLPAGPIAPITAADAVLLAFGKLQAQITKFIDQVNVYSKAQRGAIVALLPAANVYTPDASAGNFFSFMPAANFTLANPTNLPAAGITQSGSFFITQDATGGRTITFGNAYKTPGGTALVLSTAANAKDRIDYVIGPTGLIHLAIAKDIK